MAGLVLINFASAPLHFFTSFHAKSAACHFADFLSPPCLHLRFFLLSGLYGHHGLSCTTPAAGSHGVRR
jgi:hypothetical protein